MGGIFNQPDAISGAGPAVPDGDPGPETGGGGEEGPSEVSGEGGGGGGGAGGGGGLPDIEDPGLAAD
jgi:hypothetical protein